MRGVLTDGQKAAGIDSTCNERQGVPQEFIGGEGALVSGDPVKDAKSRQDGGLTRSWLEC